MTRSDPLRDHIKWIYCLNVVTGCWSSVRKLNGKKIHITNMRFSFPKARFILWGLKVRGGGKNRLCTISVLFTVFSSLAASKKGALLGNIRRTHLILCLGYSVTECKEWPKLSLNPDGFWEPEAQTSRKGEAARLCSAGMHGSEMNMSWLQAECPKKRAERERDETKSERKTLT